MLLDRGQWRSFRLPKASHSYDGAHGWNTEWPRIREIGERDLLMTMHGMFWRFPRTFSAANTAGIRPRSAYLKVIGDFCRWNDQLVFGCDDSAKSEFLNQRKVKGGIAGPGQSQSNLWFTDTQTPDQLGPALASGAVWLRDTVKAGEVSDPFLCAGWQRRSAHFINGGKTAANFTLEIDALGDGRWKPLRTVNVEPGKSSWQEFSDDAQGEWIRIKADRDCAEATAHFTFNNPDQRPSQPDAIFANLSTIASSDAHFGGIIRARGENRGTLHLAAMKVHGAQISDVGYYELDHALQLRAVEDAAAHIYVKEKTAIPREVITVDAASVLIVDDKGRRWRLPKTDDAYDEPTRAGRLRICREVATERDVFSAHGTFFELPAENADGFAKIRPIATHRFRVMDYCSYRGLLVLTGVRADAVVDEHTIRSNDGKAALWAGAIDDLWKLGKPVGRGGPWRDSIIKAGQSSDPYLLWGYDQRQLSLTADTPVNIRVEVDLTGEGHWVTYQTFSVAPGKSVEHAFPVAFQAYWLRVTADNDCTATATLKYQ
jgi:hypothetical protein